MSEKVYGSVPELQKLKNKFSTEELLLIQKQSLGDHASPVDSWATTTAR